ncbi:hypothetical protein F5J12DRAFT_915891 [Pisolithus orientalis]|uniref:uncharacterized protein n=1 Tax=Pisolithus orientalis TaxID=936130 RepID=UPI0022259EBB|nr:uncharacterized protein F5J12DRAFT_915891 [Pisolithus orientalis]KAI5988945.1 hypothetical protein F5J12DRAFT_915891 [Pisolithus orientalis]
MDIWPAVAILSSMTLGATNASLKERKKVVSSHDATILRKLNIQLSSDSFVAAQALEGVMAILLQILTFILVYYLTHGFRRHVRMRTSVLGTGSASGRILMASSATKDLFQLRQRNAKIAECVLKKIRQVSLCSSENAMPQFRICRQLSRGQFSGNNYKALHGPSHGIPIYQAEVLSNLRLVYQIDCALNDDGQEERQVVKIYGIYSHKQLDHIWPWLSKLLNGRGKEYRQRCTLREPAEPGSGVYRPATFLPRIEDFATEQSPIFVNENGSNEDLSWLVSSKYVKLVKGAFLNGLRAGREVELPFQLTFVIISSPSSLLNASKGRKNGKLYNARHPVMSLEGAEREKQPPWSLKCWVSSVLGSKFLGTKKPRQLFVTRFPVLAAKVEDFFTSLVESLALAGSTEDELRNLRSQIRSAERERPRMINPLNALNYRPGTPQKYSELSDHDFPLFITFDQAGLARMIAADIHVDDPTTYDRSDSILAKVLNDESSFITYEVFKTKYWPRLSGACRGPFARNFGAWLVFSEFMGVIKGSEKAFHSPNGILDRQTYVELSDRNYPVFAEDRHSLYSAFESYSKMKREQYGYDMADRTYAILKVLLRDSLKGQPVDYLYIDEVQDNLIIDTLLLRILCKNADGLFWAGDTAQTISAGSSFRFADLKAFIHRTEAAESIAIQKSCAKPEVFQLAINYRSHNGIVNCAQLVVKLITTFWPNSIDTLQPERAMLGGPKPIFFVGWQDETFPYEPFFSGLGGNRELGAEQCWHLFMKLSALMLNSDTLGILVRDNAVRETIRKRFGDVAVILTLQESKGLEFDDVFLYNFFEDSSATYSQWRVVLRMCSDQETTWSRDMSGIPHSVLCTELKNLYVGITRARKKLYLLDYSRNSEPLRELWSEKGLIDVAPPGTDICHYAEKSTPEQWAASGYKLFNAAQFQEAVRCFERANLPRQLQVARAYGLYEVAMSTVEAGKRQRALIDAAEALVQCADEAPGTEKTDFYGDAARCYALADNTNDAARFYIEADDFTGAAEQYRKADRFDDIVDILDRHPEKITTTCRNKLRYVCVVHYYRIRSRPPVPLFSSTENELRYLEGQELHWARIYLLELHRRFLEAAEVHLSLGQLCGAIESLFKDKQNPAALQRAVDLALDSLWQQCSFDKPVPAILQKKGSDAWNVLNCMRSISLERLNASDRTQMRLFLTVQESPFSEEVYQLGSEFSDRGEEALALMAFNVLSSQLPTLRSVRASEFDTFLRHFERYVRLLVSVVSDEITFRATDPQVKKVFGIVPLPNYQYSVTPGTFLHRGSKENRYLSVDIKDLLKAQLHAHLRKKVLEVNEASCISQAFSTQCPYSILHGGHCHSRHCNQQHERRTSLDVTSYNMKVNVHLQQIRILDLAFSAVGTHADRRTSMLSGLRRLYAVIYRPIYIEGSVANLDWNSLRNAAGCISVVRKWIQKAIEYLEPTDQLMGRTDYLMSIIRITCLHKALGGELPFQSYVSRERCRVSYGEQVLTGDDNVSADVVASLTELDSARGVRALRFLLENGVRMDLSVIRNFAEEICGTFVSSLNPSGDPSPLHGLLIPRRWIMNANESDVSRDIIQRFLFCVGLLMKILRSGKAHLKFDLPQNKESFVDAALAQMCRMLCILGYNVRDLGLSKMIADILLLPPLEVSNARNPSPQILGQLARQRQEYLETILALDKGFAIKDLVQLVHDDRRHYTRPLSWYIPRIVFETDADITRRSKRAMAF